MHACNTARSLEAMYREITHDIVDDIIPVDNGSRDSTADQAKQLCIRTIFHHFQ